MAARVRFDPQKGVRFFSDAEVEEIYLQARPFFLEQMRILLENGWKRDDCNSESEVYPSFTKRLQKQYSTFHHCYNQFLFDISKPKKGRRIILPKTFADFLDISKAHTWRKIFENRAIFNAIKKGKNDDVDLYIEPSSPLSNIFYLLQVLAPGMLVIHYEYRSQNADVKASRLLPRASWIESNMKSIVLAAAKNRKIAFREERTSLSQNNSSLPGSDALPAAAQDGKGKSRAQNTYHSSLPGSDALPATAQDQKSSASHGKGKSPALKIPLYSSLAGSNALPAAAKDQKSASHGKRKSPALKIPLHSSLTGTNALFVAAKDQKTKTASNKNKKRQPRSNNNLGGSSYDITTGGSGYDWGMCDKDCGWCGRCIENYHGDF